VENKKERLELADPPATGGSLRRLKRVRELMQSVLEEISDGGDVPLLLLFRDGDGDVVAYDLLRDGCLCHGATEAEAMERLSEVRQLWDAAALSSSAEPAQDAAPNFCPSCGWGIGTCVNCGKDWGAHAGLKCPSGGALWNPSARTPIEPKGGHYLSGGDAHEAHEAREGDGEAGPALRGGDAVSGISGVADGGPRAGTGQTHSETQRRLVAAAPPAPSAPEALAELRKAIDGYDAACVRTFGNVTIQHAGRTGLELQALIDAARAALQSSQPRSSSQAQE
jgi:predicted RNase H-like HicB family nuclease